MWKFIIEKTFAATVADPGIIAPNLKNLTQFDSLQDFLLNIPAMLIGLVGVVFLGIFFFGGYQYLASMGNEEQSKQAKETLINAIIGLVVVLVAEALVLWLKSKL